METSKKNRNIILLLLFLLVMAISALLSQCEYTSNLEKSIEAQDSILKNGNQRDSILIEKTKEYTKVITKYVSDCGFTMGKKSLSAEDVVKLINDSQSEIKILKDSLYNEEIRNKMFRIKSNDSLATYKLFLNRIESKYGIVLKVKTDGQGRRYIITNISKADSALAIFPYYRDRLRTDSAGNFVITYEKKIKVPEKK